MVGFVSRSYGTAGCCTKGYPSETHLKLKSRKISFAHNPVLRYQIALEFCTEHDSIIAMPCANFQNDYANEMDILDERDFTKFGFEMSFVRIPYIVTASQFLVALYDLFTHIYQGYFICDSRKFTLVPVK